VLNEEAMASPPESIIETRRHQMFPILEPGEIERVRRFGEVRQSGIGCCARAASGHAAAAPPRSVMNSRRFVPAMGFSPYPVQPAARILSLPPTPW
jgi:hypothetical protein